ncbi:MAG: hypothetical protein AAGF95_09125 [Chloroflexota bacterium]
MKRTLLVFICLCITFVGVVPSAMAQGPVKVVYHSFDKGTPTGTRLNLRAGDKLDVTISGEACFAGTVGNCGIDVVPAGFVLFGSTSRSDAVEVGRGDGASATIYAPKAGMVYVMMYDSLYSDNDGGYTFTISVNGGPGDKDDDKEDCKRFTSTMRYGQITVRDFINRSASGFIIPDVARQFLDRVVISDDLAYAQLKGKWCFANNRVTSYQLDPTPLNAQLTGSGPAGIVFSVEPVAVGGIIEETYGPNGQSTRYRITQTKVNVFFDNPAEINLTIPGTDIGIKIPTGQRLIYQMIMDTSLNGQGTAECAATEQAPCTVEVRDL